MLNYCQVLLSFILQCQNYPTTAVNSKLHNTHTYIPKKYNTLNVFAGISARGDVRYRIPYIAFVDDKQDVKNGYYPVFLYYKENDTLILAYGLSVTTLGASWDFSKLGITTPKTVGQYFGSAKHATKYDTSFVFKVYPLTGVVNYFKSIDVTIDPTYKTHAASFGFETTFPIDADLKEICNQYIKLLGMAGSSTSTSAPTASAVATPMGTATGGPTPAVSYPHNIILYGPPGTGKTYNTIRYAVAIAEGIDVSTIVKDRYTDRGGLTKNVKDTFKELTDPPKHTEPRIVFTTFHQSLSYEDFIEGIKPRYDQKAKILKYPTEPGLFKKICDEAKAATPQERFVLIIDEINRGNVAQIFGELITLIEEDKREGAENELKCTLPYSGEQFCVPNNLYIIGTMNTADRSVEALDSALRRRFHFVELMPDKTLVTSTARCKEVFSAINKRISILKDTEHQLGHSYFLDVQSDDDLRDVFRYNIIPLLQEYFFGDIEKMKMVLGEGFFVKETIDPRKDFPYLSGEIDLPSETYRLWGREEWENCVTKPSLFTDARDKLIDG